MKATVNKNEDYSYLYVCVRGSLCYSKLIFFCVGVFHAGFMVFVVVVVFVSFFFCLKVRFV